MTIRRSLFAAALFGLCAVLAPGTSAACEASQGGVGVVVGVACIGPNDEYAQITGDGAVDLSPLAGLALTTLTLEVGPGTDLAPLAALPGLRLLEITEAHTDVLASLPDLPGLEEMRLHTRFGLPPRMAHLPALARLDLFVVDDFALDFLSQSPGLTELRLTGRQKTDIDDLPPSPRLRTLWVRFDEFARLDGLRAAPGLTELRLDRLFRDDKITLDMAPVAALGALTSLTIDGFRGVDLSKLRSMTWLEKLACRQCDLADLDFAAGLKALTVLDLERNRVADIAMLQGLTGLRVLILSQNTRLSDIRPIAAMLDMRNLQLRQTAVADLSPLRELRPQILWIDRTPVTDLSPLSGYGEMLGLALSRTPVADLSPLAGVRMKHLNIRGTKVTDTSMIHPNAKITR